MRLSLRKRKRRMKPAIRWMLRRDAPEVLDIERRSFKKPWNEDDLVHFLQQRVSIGLVFENNGHILGFALYHLCDGRLHLEKIAVDPHHRRRGVGRAMIVKIIKKLHGKIGRSHITLSPEVRLDDPARKFFVAAQSHHGVSRHSIIIT